MKKLFFFLFALCFPFAAFPQYYMQVGPQTQVKYQKLDEGALRVFYETKAVRDTLDPERKDVDYMVLDIGKKGVSRFYSDNRRRMDSIMTEMMKKGGPVLMNTNTLGEKGISSSGDTKEIFKNFPEGKISVTDRITSSDYLYEEGKQIFNWKIEQDTREILSYNCQKAVTDFRGRHYEVWFAPDLPVNDGPWKFSGLPGLILAAEDSGKNFTFQAIGIENSDNSIEFPQKDYLKTSRSEVEKIKKKFNENPMDYIKNSMPGANIQIRTVSRDGVERTGSEVKIPYNPIELE